MSSQPINLAQLSHSDNRIIFSRKDCANQKELYKQIQKQIQLLLESKYAMSIFESKDEIIIEFGSIKPEYMESVPLWLSVEEIQVLNAWKCNKDKQEKLKNVANNPNTTIYADADDDYDPKDDETNLSNFSVKEKSEPKFYVPDYLKDDGKGNNDE